MRAVLDANVFYSTWVTDPLLCMADAELYEPVWSGRIMDEVREHLPSVWRRATREGVERYLHTLSMAFPEAMVEGWEPLEEMVVGLPDPDDRHVVAAAIRSGSGVVVTYNLKDFPDTCLDRFGLRAVSPDDFLSMLFDDDPDAAAAAIRGLVESKRHPPRTMAEEAGRLRGLGLTRFAERLATME